MQLLHCQLADCQVLCSCKSCLKFIHPFIQAISIAPLKSTTTQRRPRHCTVTVPEFHAEAPQATASEGLAKGPYVAAGAGVEPMTFWTKGVDSTNAPPTPHENMPCFPVGSKSVSQPSNGLSN